MAKKFKEVKEFSLDEEKSEVKSLNATIEERLKILNTDQSINEYDQKLLDKYNEKFYPNKTFSKKMKDEVWTEVNKNSSLNDRDESISQKEKLYRADFDGNHEHNYTEEDLLKLVDEKRSNVLSWTDSHRYSRLTHEYYFLDRILSPKEGEDATKYDNYKLYKLASDNDCLWDLREDLRYLYHLRKDYPEEFETVMNHFNDKDKEIIDMFGLDFGVHAYVPHVNKLLVSLREKYGINIEENHDKKEDVFGENDD